MGTTVSAKLHINKRGIWAVVLIAVLAAAYALLAIGSYGSEGKSLLSGRVTSSNKEALAGIPVRAHREQSSITVSVYTNSRGEYSFPAWSDVSPGSYSVAIELPDFEPVKREGVTLSAGKTTRMDLTLQPRQPSISDATIVEIAMAEPGTDDQRFLLTQCGHCHTLQWALKTPHTKEEWVRIIRRMAGERPASRDIPGSRDFAQKQYIEPLADYLATIRGPGSSDQIPFKLRPRPTTEASSHLVVTEYDIPRGGARDVYRIRGDRRVAWPHDVRVDPKGTYLWYTDNFNEILGRLDKRTGEVKEFAFTLPPGTAYSLPPDPNERSLPLERAHSMEFDRAGNVLFGLYGLIFRFDPKTEQFTRWDSGWETFGIDPSGNVWYFNDALNKLDLKSGEAKRYPVPPNDGTYETVVDSQGRSILNIYANGKIGMFDPRTEKYTEYPTSTPGSFPRRGHLDAKDRLWVSLYWAGRIARFDPNTGEVKEFPIVPDTKPYGQPFPAPYTAAVDDKNQVVWTSDFNSSRIYRLDMNTGKPTEFFMPAPYEIRDLTVDKTATRPTLWIPAYRPPSKIVRVEVR